MNEFTELLENFWIVRDENRADYVRIKYAIDNSMKHFISDFIGWKLIMNNKLIKLEKIPAEAHSFMGIQEFESTNDYCLLCALLIYLDDKYDGEQFLLTELIENVEKIISGIVDMDFTRFTDRKSLVRMLKFAQDIGLLKISEGSLEHVENDREKEILYENTGLSGYFSIHHDKDFSSFESYKDFENNELLYSDKDKGYLRKSRVYRRLLLQPAMYWNSKDDMDSLYVKNHRNNIANRIDKYIEGRLDIHNSSAFYMLNEENSFGNIHPSDKMISGFTALLCSKIKSNILNTSLMPNNFRFFIEKENFEAFILNCRNDFKRGLSKEFREMSDEKLIKAVSEYMICWMMIEEYNGGYYICDGAFKTSGKYPKDFDAKEDL